MPTNVKQAREWFLPMRALAKRAEPCEVSERHGDRNNDGIVRQREHGMHQVNHGRLPSASARQGKRLRNVARPTRRASLDCSNAFQLPGLSTFRSEVSRGHREGSPCMDDAIDGAMRSRLSEDSNPIRCLVSAFASTGERTQKMTSARRS